MLPAGIKLLSARTREYNETVLEACAYIYSLRQLKLDHTKPGAKPDFYGILLKLKIN